MDNKSLQDFKQKLIDMKEDACNLLKQMEKNETIKSNSEISAELSSYDNHPADSASSIYDKERGMLFQKNELSTIKKIDEALNSIDDGNYGICKNCGRKISKERLEYVPYAEYCIQCQKSIDNLKPQENKNRPAEEDVIKYTINRGSSNQIEFDAEDGYQSVGRFNRRQNIVEEYTDEDDEYVEPVEKISNDEYKNQLS